MKQMVMGNNTTGATIYDLGKIMQAESLADINHVLKNTEKKAQALRQEEMQHEQQLKQMEIDQSIREKQMQLDHEDMVQEKNIRKDLLVAEIKASGYGAMQDLNSNAQSDFMDQMNIIKGSQEFQESMNFEKQKESTKAGLANEKNALAREKLQAQIAMKQMDVNIAKENKNQFDVKKARQVEEQNRKKK